MTENILNTMSNRFEFITGDVLLEKENEEEILSTGVIQLDTLLGGGITAGTFLEIVGLSSAGKSQLWFVVLFCSQFVIPHRLIMINCLPGCSNLIFSYM